MGLRRMAKKRGRSKESSEAKSGKGAAGPASLLEAAFGAYEAGDMVTARAAATAALGRAAAEREQAAAKKLAPKLFAAGEAKEDPAAVAQELLARTRPPGRPYLFAAVSLAIFVLLLLVMRRG